MQHTPQAVGVLVLITDGDTSTCGALQAEHVLTTSLSLSSASTSNFS